MDNADNVSGGDRIAVLTVICGGAAGLRREGIDTLRGAGDPPCEG